jgi:hypothetical protein
MNGDHTVTLTNLTSQGLNSLGNENILLLRLTSEKGKDKIYIFKNY